MRKWYLIFAAEKMYKGADGLYSWEIADFPCISDAYNEARSLSLEVILSTTDIVHRIEKETEQILLAEGFVPYDANEQEEHYLAEFDNLCDENVYFEVYLLPDEVVERVYNDYPALEREVARNPLDFADKYGCMLM
jgi:hypothetical protein